MSPTPAVTHQPTSFACKTLYTNMGEGGRRERRERREGERREGERREGEREKEWGGRERGRRELCVCVVCWNCGSMCVCVVLL